MELTKEQIIDSLYKIICTANRRNANDEAIDNDYFKRNNDFLVLLLLVLHCFMYSYCAWVVTSPGHEKGNAAFSRAISKQTCRVILVSLCCLGVHSVLLLHHEPMCKPHGSSRQISKQKR